MDAVTSDIDEGDRKDGGLLGFAHHDDPFPLIRFVLPTAFFLLP
jgi:hypothetical protein